MVKTLSHGWDTVTVLKQTKTTISHIHPIKYTRKYPLE